MATSLLSSASRILITSPYRPFLLSFSHSIILTTTRSPSFAPLKFCCGIKISGIFLLPSATKKAKPLFISSCPYKFICLRLTLSLIVPACRLMFFFGIFTCTLTVSPCKAVLKSSGRIRISSLQICHDHKAHTRTGDIQHPFQGLFMKVFMLLFVLFLSFLFFEFFLPILLLT